jgi:hypothetical protein
MDILELFLGTAIIIDDEVNKNGTSIQKIIDQINQRNIPYLKYESLPSDKIIKNFSNVSFVLLDWDLIGLGENIKIPDHLRADANQNNIEFIQKIKEICYCPIFIFSELDINEIILLLETNNLYSTQRPNNIFIKHKSEVKRKDQLFRNIEKWVNSNPSIYVLKEWEKEYQKSKNRMFLDFQETSPVWPTIVWNTYEIDGTNESSELGEFIIRNLYSRMMPFEFSHDLLKHKKKMDKIELCNVLEGSIFLRNERLNPNTIATGDVFKIRSKYYINIRAICDLIPGRSMGEDTLDEVKLYLIEGSRLSDNQKKKKFDKEHQRFLEHEDQVIIFPLDNGKALDFHFKKLEIKPWAEVKNGERIGRLLPPYITKVQQKYSSYNQRQGLPSIPFEALN